MSRSELNVVPRIPKLAVRNRISESSTSNSDRSSVTTNSSSEPPHHNDPDQISIAISHSSREDTIGQDQVRPGSSRSGKSDLSSAQASSFNLAREPSKDDTPSIKAKKKGAAVLGFLSIKEPSASALEQFAEQQRKQAAEKSNASGRKVPVGMSGVSSQKLPANVPKVNSKWDGLPETASRSSKDTKRDDASSRRISNLSSTTSFSHRTGMSTSDTGSVRTVSTSDSRAPPNSLASSNSPLRINSKQANGYAPSLGSTNSPMASPPLPSPSITHKSAASGTSYIVPKGPSSPLRPPSLSSLPEISFFFPPDGPELPRSQRESAISVSTAPSDKSPLTPTDGTIQSTIYTKPIHAVGDGFMAGEAQEFQVPENVQLHAEDSLLAQVTSVGSRPRSMGPPTLSPLVEAEDSDIGHSRPQSADTSEQPDIHDENWPLPANGLNLTMMPTSPRPESAASSRPHTARQQMHVSDFSREDAELPPHAVDSPARSTFATEADGAKSPDPASVPLPDDETDGYSTPSTHTRAFSQDDDLITPRMSMQMSLSSERHLSRDTDTMSIAPSIAPSVAPSVMSARWYQTPQERLGLGSKIRRPGDMPDEGTGADGLMSTALKDQRKKNRFSIFGKRGDSYGSDRPPSSMRRYMDMP